MQESTTLASLPSRCVGGSLHLCEEKTGRESSAVMARRKCMLFKGRNHALGILLSLLFTKDCVPDGSSRNLIDGQSKEIDYNYCTELPGG